MKANLLILDVLRGGTGRADNHGPFCSVLLADEHLLGADSAWRQDPKPEPSEQNKSGPLFLSG